MNIETLKQLVVQGESETLEFKKSTAQLKPAFETICAFLNGTGGTVVIGIREDGKIVGQDVNDNTQLEIANMIRKIEPAADIEMYITSLDEEFKNNKPGKSIIILEASSKHHQKPYVFNGRAYERIGSSTGAMKLDKFQDVLSEKIFNENPWDKQVAKDVSYNDLDQEEILKTLREAIRCGRIDDSAIDDAKTALLKFDLLIDNKNNIESESNAEPKLTNAAVVLFSKKLPWHYSHCYVKLARFRGTNKRDFIDSQRIAGNIFKLLDTSTDFVHRNMSIASKFLEDDWRRQDIPQFPPLAVREAIINALAHRDYVQTSGYVEIGMYDDRIEIASMGNLPQGIDVEFLKSAHKSIPRNRLIADVLYRRGYIEQWGRGTNLIVNECKAFNLPDPIFSIEQGFFCVTIFATKQSYVDTAIKEDAQQWDLTDRQKEILNLIKSRGLITLGEIKTSLPNPPAERTLQDDLAKLKKLGLIAIDGHGRSAKWRVE